MGKRNDNTRNAIVSRKINELFMKWLSEESAQVMLKDYFEKQVPAGKSSHHQVKEGHVQRKLRVDEVDQSLARTTSKQQHGKKNDSKHLLPKQNGQALKTSPPNVRNSNRTFMEGEMMDEKKLKMGLPTASRVKTTEIPQFFFPKGKCIESAERALVLDKVHEVFQSSSIRGLTKEMFRSVTEDVCKLPYFLNDTLFARIDREHTGRITQDRFEQFWKENLQFVDSTDRYFHIFNFEPQKRNYLVPSDFEILLKDILQTHPGLEFLKATPAFQEKYSECVIIRIFYNISRSVEEKITKAEFKRSNFIRQLEFLGKEDDINLEYYYFSYEHFYVLYCKFWELDKDHDFVLSLEDLLKYSEYNLTKSILRRVHQGAGLRKQITHFGYKDFIVFVLSEEDKTTIKSQEYWFRCIDLDDDGVITHYEMENFYTEQIERLKSLTSESVSFNDIYAQVIDLFKPKNPNAIRLIDIKRSNVSHVFFDSLFNLSKFLSFDQKNNPTNDGRTSHWIQFARTQYELLSSLEED